MRCNESEQSKESQVRKAKRAGKEKGGRGGGGGGGRGGGGGVEVEMDSVVERQVKCEEENKSRSKSMAHMFQVPLHYPRYTKSDYESMPETKLDTLLAEYGLKVGGDVHSKRKYAMGAFLWPQELH